MTRTDREAFARRWAEAIAGTSYVSMGPDELVGHLAGLVDAMVAAVPAPEFDRSAGGRIGADLVAAHFTSTDTLSKTLALIVDRLPELLGSQRPGIDIAGRTAQLAGDIAAGYAAALRERSLDEQDSIYRAALRARKQAEHALASSEARFRQVFYSSPVGVAISEPTGKIIQCNRSLEDILDYSPGELVGRDLSELFSAGDRSAMQERYLDLINGRNPRLRGRFPLRRVDGEPVWANLNTSVLPDADSEPRYLVTMVDDITDLQLLEQRLHHQTLYDLQTGLPNRQFLLTHLEKVLARLEPSAVVTLLHLDLDGFSAINNGLGYSAGDELLDVVARRLEGVVGGRPGMVARLGADEYAIVLEPADTALDIGALAEQINAELAEPHYIGDVGIAVTATIGVAQLPVGGCRPEELMRAAGVTLRRLHNQGTRQWAPYDPDTDRAERVELQLAAALPGALESGELEVTYQPVVTLADHRLVAIEAALSWVHPQHGRLPHEQCAHAAERTGAVYAIGQWLLQTAAEQAASWQQQMTTVPPVAINLTPSQARDPDLIATITAVLADTGLAPAQLELRAPVAAIRADTGELAGSSTGVGGGGEQAEDNLRVLGELGVRAGLYDFAGGIGALRCVADLSPCTVRIATLVSEQVADGSCPILSQATHTAVHLVRAAGADVIACPVDTDKQAAYLSSVGANWAAGALFGSPGPPECIEALLTAQAGRIR